MPLLPPDVVAGGGGVDAAAWLVVCGATAAARLFAARRQSSSSSSEHVVETRAPPLPRPPATADGAARRCNKCGGRGKVCCCRAGAHCVFCAAETAQHVAMTCRPPHHSNHFTQTPFLPRSPASRAPAPGASTAPGGPWCRAARASTGAPAAAAPGASRARGASARARGGKSASGRECGGLG